MVDKAEREKRLYSSSFASEANLLKLLRCGKYQDRNKFRAAEKTTTAGAKKPRNLISRIK